jgi:hypothetical protein
MAGAEPKLAALSADIGKYVGKVKPFKKVKEPFYRVSKDGTVLKVSPVKNGLRANKLTPKQKVEPAAPDADSGIAREMQSSKMAFTGKDRRNPRQVSTVVHTYEGKVPFSKVNDALRQSNFKPMTAEPEKVFGVNEDGKPNPQDFKHFTQRYNNNKNASNQEVQVHYNRLKLRKPTAEGKTHTNQAFRVEYHHRNVDDTGAPETAAKQAAILKSMPHHLVALHQMITSGKHEQAAAKVSQLIKFANSHKPVKAAPNKGKK